MRARLYCWVDHSLGHTVSWIRQSDLQILSAGKLKFTSDPRIQILHETSMTLFRSDSYGLEISRVKREDGGNYECQINMLPLKSIIITLKVTDIPESRTGPSHSISTSSARSEPEPESQDSGPGSNTVILGAPDIYFYPGTLVNLTCLASSSIEPGRIFWYHQDKVISYYSAREGVSIYRDRKDSTNTISSLLLKEGRREDEGTYICRPENPSMKSATARLFVIDGTRSQASKTSGSSSTSSLLTLLILLQLLLSSHHSHNL